MAAAKKSAPVLDVTKLMDLPVATLEGMKALYEGTADAKVIEFAILHHSAKPVAKAAPAKPVAPPAPKVYVQRVEVYRGRARIKAVTRDQLDNVIAQLTALKNNPALLTYAECQVQFPWDKEANKPA